MTVVGNATWKKISKRKKPLNSFDQNWLVSLNDMTTADIKGEKELSNVWKAADRGSIISAIEKRRNPAK